MLKMEFGSFLSVPESRSLSPLFRSTLVLGTAAAAGDLPAHGAANGAADFLLQFGHHRGEHPAFLIRKFVRAVRLRLLVARAILFEVLSVSVPREVSSDTSSRFPSCYANRLFVCAFGRDDRTTAAVTTSRRFAVADVKGQSTLRAFPDRRPARAILPRIVAVDAYHRFRTPLVLILASSTASVTVLEIRWLTTFFWP